MTEPEIYSRVERVFHQFLPEETRAQISREASLIMDLRIDSLKVAELSILLEEAFGQPVYLPDMLAEEDDPNDLTVASLVGFLQRCLGAIQ
ncbi:MAG: hypothetical protein HYY13_00820 [Nitrospirae bacterium]|nr:hypothetical protein [Nitrospirota bacterium]